MGFLVWFHDMVLDLDGPEGAAEDGPRRPACPGVVSGSTRVGDVLAAGGRPSSRSPPQVTRGRVIVGWCGVVLVIHSLLGSLTSFVTYDVPLWECFIEDAVGLLCIVVSLRNRRRLTSVVLVAIGMVGAWVFLDVSGRLALLGYHAVNRYH